MTPHVLYDTIPSPIGELLLIGDRDALHGLHMLEGRRPVPVDPRWRHAPDAFTDVAGQLDEYFQGRRATFTVPLALTGTTFQLRVWAALQQIGHGQTISYAELARRIGQPAGARAVGLANGRNPVAVIVPCHRVIATDGRLTGYGGGLERKRLLLDLESGAVPLL
ncbi:MAG TPA: methylated-DNA--[protein]-cysteine S-methyltransferase [Solirubrobacteraceae bacterium]|jgi:methylated-DNA-[protein]-cysteine S-methyltransferase